MMDVPRADKSGAKVTAVQTLARLPGNPKFREAFGLRRVHRRFSPGLPSQNEYRKRVPVRLHLISVFAMLRRDESARQVANAAFGMRSGVRDQSAFV